MAPARARAVDVAIVGAGHCGLAMSHALSRRSIEHVVLERGEAAHAWRTQRWPSLSLLTPNWMCRLPGHRYRGDDPDGYMRADEVAAFVSDYAARIRAPVLTGTTVLRAAPSAGGWQVQTDRGEWRCRALVIATGACSRPVVPAIAASLPPSVAQWTPDRYRSPQQLDAGGVLVVGASATGVQLAREIRRSGRRVLLATGEHVRMPRVYRGRDIQWWMLAAGMLDQRIEQMDDPGRARRLPSPQLAGTPDRATLDLNALRQDDVEVVGRLAGVRDGRALFSGSLRNVCALADLKMNRLLDALDAWAAASDVDRDVGPVERYAATDPGPTPRLGAALGSEIRSVVWATGFRPDHGWLDAPVFDRHGALRHDRGVAALPGLYALGLPFMRRRKSSFIHGAADDVRELVVQIVQRLRRQAAGSIAAADLGSPSESVPRAPAP